MIQLKVAGSVVEGQSLTVLLNDDASAVSFKQDAALMQQI